LIDGTVVNRQMLQCYEPTDLPDLSRYGVDYDEYVKAFKPADLIIAAPRDSGAEAPDRLEIGAWTGL
jgi:hypothetical protein